jgi:hypothetical protein
VRNTKEEKPVNGPGLYFAPPGYGGALFVRAWPCSPLRSFSLIRKTELWRTNKPPALRVVRIALALCKKTSLDIIKTGSPTVL